MRATRGRRTWLSVGAGILAAAMASAVAACSSSSGRGAPSDGGAGADGTASTPEGSSSADSSSGYDATTAADGSPSDAGAGSDTGSGTNAACSDAAVGPLGLTCPDFPGVAPCPNQALLTDSTRFAALQAAMKSGTLLNDVIPYSSSDPNIAKEKCGLQGFWNPVSATELVPPATPIPELASLFAPSSNGYSGVCASFTSSSPSTDGFPAAGTYRLQFHAAYQGQTYVIRARATVSGTAAGQSFASTGLSDAGGTPALFGGFLYQVNGASAPEPTLWTSVVGGFTSSASQFPSVTLSVQETAGGPVVWTSKIELLCASETAAPSAGPTVLTVKDTIDLPGSPTSMAYNAGTKKAYFGCSTVSDAGYTENAGIAVVDDTTDTVVGSVSTSNLVVALAANGTTKTIYASEQTQIDVIDSTMDKISTTVAIPNSGQAEGFAIDEANNKVYVLGGSSVYVLDGSTNTIGATPIALTGFSAPTAAFNPGEPVIALDPSSHKLYAIGYDMNLNGLVVTVDATSSSVTGTTSLAPYQATGIAVVPGVGAVVKLVNTSGGAGAALVGQTPASISFTPGGIAACGSTIQIVGSDSFGNASAISFAPSAGALGSATTFDASELTENGEVPASLLAASVSAGCSFYAAFTYNANVLYTPGTTQAPAAPAYVVKFGHP